MSWPGGARGRRLRQKKGSNMKSSSSEMGKNTWWCRTLDLLHIRSKWQHLVGAWMWRTMASRWTQQREERGNHAMQTWEEEEGRRAGDEMRDNQSCDYIQYKYADHEEQRKETDQILASVNWFDTVSTFQTYIGRDCFLDLDVIASLIMMIWSNAYHSPNVWWTFLRVING
jgi:uncharacterized protein YlxW (UPF0749 family)